MYKVELWWTIWTFNRIGYPEDIEIVKEFEEDMDVTLINCIESGPSCYFICDEEKLLYFEMKHGENIYYKVVKIDNV